LDASRGFGQHIFDGRQPQQRGLVVAGGDDGAAIGAEGGRVDTGSVSLALAAFLSGLC